MSAEDSTPIIDLRFTHAVHQRGDVAIVLTWNIHRGEGCIVLLPASGRVAPENIVPCIVNEADAWRWHDKIGDPFYQENNAALFACALGLPSDLRSIHMIMSIIQDHLDDFTHIPPMPDAMRVHVADAFAVDQDGKEIHQEVHAYA